MMKKVVLLLLAFCTAGVLNAQMLSPEVIAAGGDYFESSVGSLSWTLGEPVTETVENGSINIILTQGFQQPFDEMVGINTVRLPDVSVNLYPNPTLETVRLDVKYDNTSQLKIELIDMLGRVLHADELDVLQGQLSNYQMDVSSLSSGTYMFRLTDKGQLLSTYKFQKVGY